MNFDQAFEKLIGHEGGYANNPADPGGETRYGISRRAYPLENIKAMTLERAKVLYLHDYWAPAGCDAVPDAIKFDLFDMAVNSGPVAAIKNLQRAVGVTIDGMLGPLTLQAINGTPTPRVLARFNGHRLDLMVDLKGWPAFSRGWAKRIAANLKEA
ncbi:glycoside hydrolase family 108 protein [Aquabacterium sp.]|uniref:glycoside hydrolase family 108 protein n=1 Tax=Aquabacterium sp. TaxID=1872578 RepID=UPI0040379C3F